MHAILEGKENVLVVILARHTHFIVV